jgi:DNA-binding IclR family transcriptional regulator
MAPTIETSRGSQTLARGLEVLDILADAPHALSASELARRLALPRSVVARLLTTLELHGYVERTDAGARRLGPAVLALAGGLRSTFGEQLTHHLDTLAILLGSCTALARRDGDEIVVVDVVEPRSDEPAAVFRIAARRPIDRAVLGVAVLSANPRGPNEPDTVARARQRGYAVSEAGGVPWCLAAPVFVRPRYAEMSIGVVSARPLDERVAAMWVTHICGQVALSLGHRTRNR